MLSNGRVVNPAVAYLGMHQTPVVQALMVAASVCRTSLFFSRSYTVQEDIFWDNSVQQPPQIRCTVWVWHPEL